MRKRILAFILSSIMVISGTVTAFAKDGIALQEADTDQPILSEDEIIEDIEIPLDFNEETLPETEVDIEVEENLTENDDSITPSSIQEFASESELKSITLVSKNVEYRDIDGKLRYKTKYVPIFDPYDYQPQGNIVWTSSDEQTVTVDNEGILTYHDIGYAVITATVDGVSGSMDLYNNPNLNDVNIIVNDDYSITFAWKKMNRAEKYIIYRVATESVAFSVEENGSGSYEFTDDYFKNKPAYAGTSPGYVFSVVSNGKTFGTGTNISLTPSIKLNSIDLEETTLTKEYAQLKPVYNPSDYVTNRFIEWKSSDELTAIVNTTGLVTFKDIGETDITATINGITGTKHYEIKPDVSITQDNNSVKFTWNAAKRATNYTIYRGDDFQNPVFTSPNNQSTYEFTDTLPESSLTDDAGTVKYVLSITGIFNGINDTRNYEYEVKTNDSDKPDGLLMELKELYATDSSATLVPVFNHSDYVPKGEITWTSSDEKTATVDNNGKVTFKDIGTTTITATVDGISASKYYKKFPKVKISHDRGKVTLSWNSSSRITHYSIYRYDLENERDGLIFDADNTKKTYTITDDFYKSINAKTRYSTTLEYDFCYVGDFEEGKIVDSHEIAVSPSSSGEESTEYDEEWGDIPESIQEQLDYDPENIPIKIWFVVDNKVLLQNSSKKLDITKQYTGSKITFDDDISVYYNKKKLKNKIDYTVTYSKNISSVYSATSAPSFTIKTKGDYKGLSKTFTFNISPASLEDAVITSDTLIPVSKCSKKLSSIKVTVSYRGKELKKGKYYTLVYNGEDGEIENPSKVKLRNVGDEFTINVVAKENGNFIGEAEATATVIVVDPKEVVLASKFKLGNDAGNALTFTYCEINEETLIEDLFAKGIACVYYKKELLTFNEDYSIEAIEDDYSTVGVHKIRLIGNESGSQNFIGTKIATFKVLPYNISNDIDERLSIEVDDAEYKKGGAKPEVIVTFNGPHGDETLTKGVDYTVSYKNNTKEAECDSKNPPTVIIKGKGKLKGTAKATFSIYPDEGEDEPDEDEDEPEDDE